MLLNSTKDENGIRHDKLLFPAFLLAGLAFVGTVFIPSGGIVLCFLWGFLRGLGGAWADFLIGMAIIEFSRLKVEFGNGTYEHIVSVNTAQSSTARNIGSFVASVITFAFFAKHQTLGDAVANSLLLGTAAIFFLAALVSLKFQHHVDNLFANLKVQRYDTVENPDEEHADDEASTSSTNSVNYSSSSFQHSSVSQHSGSERFESDRSVSISSPSHISEIEETTEQMNARRGQMIEVSTLVAFQILLAVSALQKPIVKLSNQTIWNTLVATFVVILFFFISLGHRFERQSMTGSSSPPFTDDERKEGSQSHRLPHKQLNLYFLLRYSMPIAGFLMYSYLYSVFEKELSFLQLLSVLKTAIGSLSTFCYEKFISPHCHSGWPLIALIASLDIIMGFVSLLDVWLIRAVKDKEVNGEYTLDTSLRCLVAAVGLVKYFFAELDYMPALVLSTTNVYIGNDKTFESKDHGESPASKANNDFGQQSAEMISLSEGFPRPNISALSIDVDNEEDRAAARPLMQRLVPKTPLISAGMQYASFLSCIDFGSQVGDWITIPIVASLGITRDNHWDNLDKLVIICSFFRMTRVVFLWLILPPTEPKLATRSDHNEYSNINDSID